MVVHELATNSVKYGALSCAEGVLDVSSRSEGEYLELIWAETGGPSVDELPELTGFGSKLVARSVQTQLRGELHYDWQKTGLVVTVKVRQELLAN